MQLTLEITQTLDQEWNYYKLDHITQWRLNYQKSCLEIAQVSSVCPFVHKSRLSSKAEQLEKDATIFEAQDLRP